MKKQLIDILKKLNAEDAKIVLREINDDKLTCEVLGLPEFEYLRTKGGDFYKYDPDSKHYRLYDYNTGNCSKTCKTIIDIGDDCIIGLSNDPKIMIESGDLIYVCEDAHIVTSTIDAAFYARVTDITAIYTPNPDKTNYQLVWKKL